ncbi:hypothetical protein J6590_078570 [Homalodisca vitripennis]|nr:hypothetical protein J6590_078570 [Homalodisca vitripennis]
MTRAGSLSQEGRYVFPRLVCSARVLGNANEMDPLHQANKLRLIHRQTDNKWTYREAIMLDTLMLMSSLV